MARPLPTGRASSWVVGSAQVGQLGELQLALHPLSSLCVLRRQPGSEGPGGSRFFELVSLSLYTTTEQCNVHHTPSPTRVKQRWSASGLSLRFLLRARRVEATQRRIILIIINDHRKGGTRTVQNRNTFPFPFRVPSLGFSKNMACLSTDHRRTIVRLVFA